MLQSAVAYITPAISGGQAASIATEAARGMGEIALQFKQVSTNEENPDWVDHPGDDSLYYMIRAESLEENSDVMQVIRRLLSLSSALLAKQDDRSAYDKLAVNSMLASWAVALLDKLEIDLLVPGPTKWSKTFRLITAGMSEQELMYGTIMSARMNPVPHNYLDTLEPQSEHVFASASTQTGFQPTVAEIFRVIPEDGLGMHSSLLIREMGSNEALSVIGDQASKLTERGYHIGAVTVLA